MTTSTDALDRFVGRVRGLYSLPAVAVKVLELTAQPHVDLRALKICIENDPALATKVLRVVNSSLFGLSCEIRDLSQALALLGIKPLKLLVLGFSLSEALCSSGTSVAVDRYWRHTLTQAVAAREISERIWRLPGDEAFLAALLRDVGILVLLQELGPPYARLLEKATAADKDIASLESSVLGFDHRALAARLLDLWNLPGSMVAAINLSLRPASIEYLTPAEQALPRVLRLSQLMADLVVDRRCAALERLYCEPAATGPLSVDQVQELVATLEAKVEQLAGVFAFELPEGIGYRDVLVEAHTQMSQVATEMACDWLNSGASESFPAEAGLLKDTQDLAAAATRYAAAPAVVREPTADRVSTTTTLPPVVRPSGGSLAAVSPRTLDSELVQQLDAALTDCRQQRAPLSLVLVEIDRFDGFVKSLGLVVAEELLAAVGRLCQECDVPGASAVPSAQACCALILPGCDRADAVRQGDRLLVEFREYVEHQPNSNIAALTVSVGVATVPSPPKNFRVEDLISRAGRCLSAAQHSGNSVKSIGIY